MNVIARRVFFPTKQSPGKKGGLALAKNTNAMTLKLMG
jgi:hypothetical protein